LINLAVDNHVAEDRYFTPEDFLGIYPDGAYLTYEQYGAGNFKRAARARTAVDTGTPIYDDATLLSDTGWRPTTDINSFPFLLGAKSALIDDAGNAYIGFVLRTNGDESETYVAGFARDGRRLWGLDLPSYGGWGGAECDLQQVLSGHRLLVVCPGHFTNRFVIIGE
jgi:hypothetical protein